VGEREFLVEPRHAAVEGAVALAARLLGEGAPEVRLPRAGRPADQNVVVGLDPAAGGELAEEGLVELAARLVVDVLDARLAQAQLRLAQRGRQAAVLAGERLGLDEEAEALERDRGERRILLLGEPGGREGVEPQGLELLEGRFIRGRDYYH